MPDSTTQLTPKEILLAKMAFAAVTAEVRTGLPAIITLSQWAIESAWGTKPVPGFNYFGMKYTSRHYSFYWSWTTEYYNSTSDLESAIKSLSIRNTKVLTPADTFPIKVHCEAKFASYSSPQSSLDDYVYLLTLPSGPYGKSFQLYLLSLSSSSSNTSAINFLAISISGIYATSPDYAKLLLTIMNQSNIASAIASAKASATPQPPESLSTNSLGRFIEPTTTLTSLLDILSNGSSLSYTQPYFYLHPPVGPPSVISSWDLGFRPMGSPIGLPESPTEPQTPLNNS